MNRREYLAVAGGSLVAVGGGAGLARATRADIAASGELNRGSGAPVTREQTITRESVEYLPETNEVRERGSTQAFDDWARRECAAIGAREVLAVVQNRFDTAVEGVGSGVRHLLFGPAVTVDHTVTRDRDGEVTSEPNVTLDALTAAAPRTMTITVILDGQRYTRELPVGVGHTEVSAD